MAKKTKKRKRSLAGRLLITAGVLCFLAAGALGAYNIWDSYRAGEASAKIEAVLVDRIKENMQEGEPEEPAAAGSEGETSPAGVGEELLKTVPMENPEATPYKDMPVEEIDGYRYIGFLEIPSLGLSLPVMEDWDYTRLKVSPCRYSGSYYTDDLVICGHNYSRHFTPVKDSLGMGQDVYFTNVLGESIRYTTVNKETVAPTNIEDMIANSNNSGRSTEDWDLTLFTCNLGGQTRSAVRCQRVRP